MRKLAEGISLSLVVCLSLVAQVDRASLNGTVTDASGAMVTGAKVEAVSSGTGLRRQTLTGASGTYDIPELPIGTYTVIVSKDGFKSVGSKDVVFAVDQARTIDARLEVGSTSDSVEVTAPLEEVNRSSAEVGGSVETVQIAELPVSGRNWASLMLLTPGAVNYGDGAQRSIQFNGHSLDDNNFAFDGIDTSGVQEQTQKSDARLNIALDSIAEFRVSTAVYTAESGAAGGAQIDVVSKSGSNAYHGSGFYAVRNDALDSRSPFDGATIPPFTLNQFGVSLGGAFIKNKAFFYANYEGLRQSLGQTFINYIPNASFRAQALATSPVLAPLLAAYPTGGTPYDSLTNIITNVATDTVREDAGMFRFDYHFTDNTTAYARYNIDNAYADSPTDALGGHNVIPLIPTNVVLELQHIFSPVTVDEAKFGINRANYHNWGYGTSPVAVSFGSNFDGVSDTSLDTEVGTTFNYLNNLTMTRGRHTLKVGVEIRRIRLNNSGNTLTTSSLSYDTPADFINNSAASATYLQGEGVVGQRRTFSMGYFQDDFKATPTLTLNLGLRYEYYSVAHEILNRSAVVDILGCGGYCPKGTPYYDPNTKDFGPRIGLAWAPAMFHGHTTIRSGFGIYFGGNQNDDFSDPAESAVPRYSVAASDCPGLDYPLTTCITSNPLYSPKAIDRHRKDLSYNDWDFMVQQELPGHFLAQIGYLGSEGHHLFDKYTVNLINPLTGKRPLAAFGSFGLKANDGNDNYNALQATLHRRFTRGFLFQTNYVWGKAIADASTGSGTSVGFQNMSCRACDRSDSPVDVRHTLTVNGIYELPFGHGKQFLSGNGLATQIFGGWELMGIATARTGLPVNITMSRKAAALPDQNTSGQRPNLVPGVPIYAANPSINGWFNPAAFSMPANGTWGNLGRYIAKGPGNYEIDSTLQKRFRVTEKLALNLRASAYNLMNHPQYKTPSGSLGSLTGSAPISAGFGKITSTLNAGAVGAGAPRRIEFMLRAEF